MITVFGAMLCVLVVDHQTPLDQLKKNNQPTSFRDVIASVGAGH